MFNRSYIIKHYKDLSVVKTMTTPVNELIIYKQLEFDLIKNSYILFIHKQLEFGLIVYLS